jgi:O-antigen ligase
MTRSAVVLRNRRQVVLPAPPSPGDRARSVRIRAGVAWGLLVLNSLTWYGSVLPLPHAAGQLLTQAALPAALVVALSANRRVVIRPNVFLCLVTLLVVDALITVLQPQYLGNVYRTVRLVEFVAALWLLTPWWGRRDLLLLRAHLTALFVALGTVVVGLFLFPGHALEGGRLGGVIYGIPATEVAHYAVVTTGLMLVLWLGGAVSGRLALLVAVVCLPLTLLTHTRTAMVALVAAVLVAVLSLVVTKARARRFVVAAAIGASVVVMAAASVITTWLERGQSADELGSLTGRTEFWTLVLNLPRNMFQQIFGFGLTNGSVNGLPIDSNWLVAYLEQGLLGVAVCAAMILFLLVTAFLQPPGTRRALALFLVTYALIASFTQVGFAQPTTYLLELTLAAAILAPPVSSRAG